MEWAKIGLAVLQEVAQFKRNSEIQEIKQERDMYRTQAHRLQSQLDTKKTNNINNSGQYKSNYHKQAPKYGTNTSSQGTSSSNTSRESHWKRGSPQGRTQHDGKGSQKCFNSNSTTVHVHLHGRTGPNNFKKNPNGQFDNGRNNFQNAIGGRGRGRGKNSYGKPQNAAFTKTNGN